MDFILGLDRDLAQILFFFTKKKKIKFLTRHKNYYFFKKHKQNSIK